MKRFIAAAFLAVFGLPSFAATYHASWNGHTARGFVTLDENAEVLDYQFEARIISSTPTTIDTKSTGPFNRDFPRARVTYLDFPLFAKTLGDIQVNFAVETYDCLPSPPFTCTPDGELALTYLDLTDSEGLAINWTVTEVPLPAGGALLVSGVFALGLRRKS
ncbi:hypothetical protein SAMN05421762_1359 [Pseudooceanicola nitratireducens]|jgi:hypothetical protein|uniref:PEP-CTERM protein-sorting domain-containing protein n=1 Tax=Pseudooceanicola nitratireducens TaxID=517719 RepID=A0A1I1K721_9RHOB|nr:hypothetical protein [Pseudooceanicola nitratireducens]SEJ48249.1 hypothetical protein SAMN05216183_103433 [Pseudooceanicola nitratireducens]SFC56526.1 hypothetical protein SAMN05421762_1359 [Pseudooceanicola nitratireducens]